MVIVCIYSEQYIITTKSSLKLKLMGSKEKGGKKNARFQWSEINDVKVFFFVAFMKKWPIFGSLPWYTISGQCNWYIVVQTFVLVVLSYIRSLGLGGENCEQRMGHIAGGINNPWRCLVYCREETAVVHESVCIPLYIDIHRCICERAPAVWVIKPSARACNTFLYLKHEANELKDNCRH